MITHWDQSAYPPSSDEQSSNDGICGISACKVYPLAMSPSKAVGPYPTFSTSPQLSPVRRGRRQLFSVALSVISTYFSASVEIPGSSPVQCSVLSGLSFSRLRRETIARFVANSKFKKNFRTIICK